MRFEFLVCNAFKFPSKLKKISLRVCGDVFTPRECILRFQQDEDDASTVAAENSSSSDEEESKKASSKKKGSAPQQQRRKKRKPRVEIEHEMEPSTSRQKQRV